MIKTATSREFKLLTRPTAIIIGAERSGSTSLHWALGQHPNVFVPKRKELNYWARDEFGEMPPWTSEHVRSLTPKTWREYQELWASGSGHKARLETSVIYLRDPTSADRIVKQFYRIDLIAVLRHPVDHAWSMYKTLHEHPTIDGFQAALASFERVSNSALALHEYGLYARALEPWYKAIGHEDEFSRNWVEQRHGRSDAARLKVVLFDDLVSHPETTIADLLTFMGVDPNVRIELQHLNQAGSAKIGLLKQVLDGSVELKRIARACLPERAVHQLTAAHHKVRSANIRESEKLTRGLRRELINHYYREDLLKLECLIKHDLSRWLVKPRSKVRRAQHRVGAVAS